MASPKAEKLSTSITKVGWSSGTRGGRLLVAATCCVLSLIHSTGSLPAAPLTGFGSRHAARAVVSLRPGESLTYRIRYFSHTDADLRALAAQPGSTGAAAGSSLVREFDTGVSGELRETVLAAAGSGSVVAYRFAYTQLQIVQDHLALADSQRVRLAADLSEPLYCKTSDNGAVTRIWTGPNYDLDALRLAETLIGLVQFAPPKLVPRRASSWTTVEQDPAGRYTATYQFRSTSVNRSDSTISKTKQTIPVEARSAAQDSIRRPSIVRSGALIGTWSKGHLRRLAGAESQKAVFIGQTVAVTRSSIELTLDTDRLEKLQEFRWLAANEAALAKASPGETLYRPLDIYQLRRSARTNTLGPETLSSLTAELLASPPPSERQASDLYLKFRALEYLQPASCADVGAMLSKADAKSPAFDILCGSLANVGSPEAQSALVAVLKARGNDELALLKAIPALATAQSPSEEALSELDELSRSPVKDVATTAQLGLGAASRSLKASAPERASEIVRSMIARFPLPRSQADAEQLMLVLGNSGSSDALPILESYCADSDARLRADASNALRFVSGDTAERLLLHALSADPDPSVRLAALGSFAFRPATAEVVAAECDALARDPNADVRGASLKNLWALHTDWPEVLGVVKAAEKDPSSEVSKAAKELLLSSAAGAKQ